jgi:hypothetical protein
MFAGRTNWKARNNVEGSEAVATTGIRIDPAARVNLHHRGAGITTVRTITAVTTKTIVVVVVVVTMGEGIPHHRVGEEEDPFNKQEEMTIGVMGTARGR